MLVSSMPPPVTPSILMTQCSLVSTQILLLSPLLETPSYFTVLRPPTVSLPILVQLPQFFVVPACSASFFHCGQASFTSCTCQYCVMMGFCIIGGQPSMYMCLPERSTTQFFCVSSTMAAIGPMA